MDRRGRRRGRRRDGGAGVRRDRARSTSTTTPLPDRRRRREGDRSPARRSSTRTPRTTSCSTGRSATRTAPRPRSRTPKSVVKQRIVNHRLIPNPMEVRGDIGWYNPGTDEYTIWMSSQTPHIQRLLLDRVRDRASRSTRSAASAPTSAARSARRSSATPTCALVHVREQGDRRAAGEVGREPDARTTRARSTAATTSRTSRSPASATARSRASAVKTFANLGGRLSTIGPGIPTTLYARVLHGCYKHPEHLLPRSPGSTRTRRSSTPTAAPAGRRRRYVIERAMDLFANEIGMDQAARPAQELHPARPVPVRGPVRVWARPAAGPRSTSTRATTSRR